MSQSEDPARDPVPESARAAEGSPSRSAAGSETDTPGRDLPSGLRAVAAEAGPQPRPMPAPEILPGRQSAAPGRPSASASQPRPTGLERAMQGVRAALPLVQKVLPLLEGRVFTALSNLLAPHPAPPPPADLSPLEGSLADIRTRHMELFNQVVQQNASLRRVADRLDQVQATADRNAQEQQELRQTLQSVGRKANMVAITALCLLGLSLAANVFLFLHFQHVPR